MLFALLTLLTFLTPFYIIYKPPHLLIRYFAHRWPDVLWHVSLPPRPAASSPARKQKILALTIDDAPSEFTLEIANVLREHDARATFFVIGAQVAGREQVLPELVGRGMELGNHAMRDEPSRGLGPENLAAQISSVDRLINSTYEAVGVSRPPRYFRPGSGFFSTWMREVVAGMGYRMVLGGVYPHDPQIGYAWLNARHVLSMVRSGSIIICHDRRSWTAPMLRKVLPELKRRGYVVTTVSGLLEAASQESSG
ncbi:hypothetical protein LEMA_P049820.1 [Plenodomus lingam JN3]|uniref:chitin deacetylase n=1 Tax=Leptosphaeria maculans (strain JN3 / isolate v23.1.3 / race Av1-4-5-6-7-8) TaxID=985895 RepID=E5R503_LEPMJ|nr:hypothetical protein LEMA_P049820.1 [Plenodomus lingam JN3]CBX92276.1 hypothetical protein LEMA_P049820.1 [Plenodomus lingam JN3]